MRRLSLTESGTKIIWAIFYEPNGDITGFYFASDKLAEYLAHKEIVTVTFKKDIKDSTPNLEIIKIGKLDFKALQSEIQNSWVASGIPEKR